MSQLALKHHEMKILYLDGSTLLTIKLHRYGRPYSVKLLNSLKKPNYSGSNIFPIRIFRLGDIVLPTSQNLPSDNTKS